MKGYDQMRIGTRRLSQMILLASLISISSVVFQNCGTYVPAESDDVASLGEDVCTGTECVTNPESILLQIANAEPERLLNNAVTKDVAFDVGGYCDPAGYPVNRIVWQLNGPTGIGATTLQNACDSLGRFRIRVNLPANYDYGALHTLVVQLIAIDSGGNEIRNPLGLHRREFGVVGQVQ